MNLAKSTQNLNRRRVIARSAAVCLLILACAKTGFDWYLKQQDEQLKPTFASLVKMLAEYAKAQSELDGPRPYPLPEDLRAALKSPSDFRVDHTIAAIPDSVRTAFAQATHDEAFLMAEPGGRWEATDVSSNPRLPRRRLTTVATSGTFCLLFYERGGRGRSNDVAAFRLLGDRAEAIWHANLNSRVMDPAALHGAPGGEHFDQAGERGLQLFVLLLEVPVEACLRTGKDQQTDGGRPGNYSSSVQILC